MDSDFEPHPFSMTRLTSLLQLAFKQHPHGEEAMESRAVDESSNQRIVVSPLYQIKDSGNVLQANLYIKRALWEDWNLMD